MQKEQGDAVESFAFGSGVVTRVKSLATPKMLYVEAAQQNEASFTVTSPKELSRVSIPAVSGRSTKIGAALVSVASNTILIAVKVVAGLLTGSIAILTEAVHSAVDLVASLVALFSIRNLVDRDRLLAMPISCCCW